MNVLVVDDNESDLSQLQALLAGNGHTVATARQGAEALERARQLPPDLVVSDLLMPVMDGFSLCRAWQQDPGLRAIPFIFYTATHTDGRDRDFALRLGARRFLLKPEDPGTFLRIIREVGGQGNRPADTEAPAFGTPREKEETVKLLPYNEALIRQLEQKMLLLEQANRRLESNIAERKQAELHIDQLNRVYAVLSDINQNIVRQTDLRAMLQAACRTAVTKGRFQMAWIGLVDAATGRLHITGHAGATAATVAILRQMVERETPDCVFTYHALHTCGHGVCNDIAGDPRTVAWRAAALQRGYRSMASLPLKNGETCIGTFNLYSPEAEFFDPEEMRLLDELAMDISFAIEVSRREAGRRQAEEELRWRTAFFEAQVDSALDGILVVDSHGKKILQNRRLQEVLKIPGLIAENSNDAGQTQFIASQIRNPGQFAEKIAYLNAHPNEISRDEMELVDGTILDRYSSPVRGKDGRYYGRIWTFRDITERKRAEESLTRLATAVEQSAESIVMTDPNGTIVYVNRAFEKATGYVRAEAIGQNARILKSGKQDAAYYRQMWAVLKRGEVWSGHFINRRKDGTFFEEEATISPIRDTAGKIVNYVAAKRDVTREVQLEAQFRQSQKMEAIGLLAGGISHDFNNILAVMQMQLDLLRADRRLVPDQAESAEEIAKSIQRAADLTRQLLLFSRKQTPRLVDLDLNEAVYNVTKMLRRLVGENIQVQFNFSAQQLLIHADGGMLDQVFINLAVNARDAMPRGGQLTIETAAVELDEAAASRLPGARPGSFTCVAVSDTGCGIAPEVLSHIFEPFFTTKEVGKGTGLGLATVFGIVQQHRGWVQVQSELGQGATFKIYLPRLLTPTDSNLVGARPLPLVTGHETILLVEDEAAVRRSVRSTLTRLGYTVLDVSTGAEALAVWERRREEIRLLLADLVMPGGMNGKELAEALARRDPKLKIIFLSGYSTEVAGKDLMLTEGVNFLPKPFEAYKLARTIRNCLDEI
jgi:PAS domain S-box-containing protein